MPRKDHPEEIAGILNNHPDLATDLLFLLEQIGVQYSIYRKTDTLSIPHTTLDSVQVGLTYLDNIAFGAPTISLTSAFDNKGCWLDGQMSFIIIRNGASWKSSGLVNDLRVSNFTVDSAAMQLTGEYSRCFFGGHVTIKGEVKLYDSSDMNLGKIVGASGNQVNRIIIGIGCKFKTTDPIPANVELIDLNKTLVNVATRTGSVLKFDQHAEYLPIFANTFTVDTSGKVVGAVVYAYLGPGTTEPSLPAGFQRVSTQVYKAGVSLMYGFKVGANGAIQYSVTELPA